jgi:hypothetical protein
MRRFAVESVVPPAFVIDVADPVGEPALGTVLATGFHGASHTPLRLEVPCAGLGAPELARLERAADPAADRLLAHYAARFARRLPASSPGHGTRAYREYAASLGHYLHSADIHAALSGYASAPALPAPVTPLMSDFERCRGRTVSAVHKALELASYLLRRPDTRYVWVRDCGRSSGEQAGYDGHESLVSQTFPNLSSTLELLVTLLAGPDHLRLPDNTLVVLTTEFGRTPVEQEDQGGRNHWPAGYVNVVFRPARPGSSSAPTTIGEISAADGRAVIGAEPARNALNPTDLRAALLLALGIDPFESSNFAQGSLSGRFQGVIEAVARRRLKDLLGYGEVSA